MPSPPRLRRSPPRRPLHERSESRANEGDSPTLRLVHEPDSPFLDNPFPTKPSQILLPSGQRPPLNLLPTETPYQREPLHSAHILSLENQPAKIGSPLDGRRECDTERTLKRSSTELSFYTTSARHSTAFASLTLEKTESSFGIDRQDLSSTKAIDVLATLTDSSAEPHNETTKTEREAGRQPCTKDSDNSLSSTNTTGTVVVKKTRDGKKRASYSAFPYSARPPSSRSTTSTPTSQTSSPKIPEEPSGSQSSESPVASHSPTLSTNERRISSAPAESDASKLGGGPVRLQYPTIRPPSASGSWAESSSLAPPTTARAVERAQQRWNPHLSTVHSEGTNSMSLERNSQSMWLPCSSRASQSSSKIQCTHTSSEQPVTLSRNSSDLKKLSEDFVTLSPLPSPPPVKHRDFSGSTIRVVNEQAGDDRPNVPPTIPGSQDSTHASTVGSRNLMPGANARPGSRASFFRDSIPAWAKTYYARPISSASQLEHRDSVATDNISLNVWRPRNRDSQGPPRPSRRRSGLAMHPTRPDDLTVANSRGFSRRLSPTLSPRLWRDRASVAQRRSIFKAPSIDDAAEGHTLSKRNAQILCFAAGFIFPLTWFVAAFLPLPPKPALSLSKGKDVPRGWAAAFDLEKRLCPTDLARYENARWWRIINRSMCVAGTAIIVLVVSRS